jgi:hypothetical protein
MMTKVYLVYGFTPYEGEETMAAFSTLEKAKEYLKNIPTGKGYWETYDIYDFELDAS